MELTLNELAKIELAKRDAERNTIKQIYKEKGDKMMEECKVLIKDIISTLHTIFNKHDRFEVSIYDGRRCYENGEVVISIKMKYGYSCADAGHTNLYIQPNGENLLVATYFDMRDKVSMTSEKFVNKLIKVEGNALSSAFRNFIK
jgi:hypothetical protein